MKLKLYTVAGLMMVAGLVSCSGNKDAEVVDKSIIPTAEEKAAAAQTQINTATAPTAAGATSAPGTIPGVIQPQQNGAGVSTITMPNGQSVAMPAGPISITPNTPQQNVVMTPAQTQAQPTTPGMNPPHGQPGHRCDIAVGAPLNSKPAAPAAAQATTVNAQPQVTMQQVPTTTKTAPGMNPPHGEPGHRCDIAVGAPLNSKPAATTTVSTNAAPASIAPPPLLTTPKSDTTKN